MKEEKTLEIKKLTFEAVQSAQELLRQKLNELIDEQRCIKDEEERTLFMKLLGFSTLGLGLNVHVSMVTKSHVGFRTNVEWVARWACSQKTNFVYVPIDLARPIYQDNAEPNAEMTDVWKTILHYLYTVFPKALDKSMSMSKERESKSGDTSFVIPDE